MAEIISGNSRKIEAAMRLGRLIVFARYPEPGQAKTRLIPAIGPERAARLQEALTHRTLRTGSDFCSRSRCELEVRFAGRDAESMVRLFGADHRFACQMGADLGDRLAHAINEAFTDGANRVLVVGTDSPGITPELLTEGYRCLNHADVVIGPALDGGYYLIGLRGPHADLFRGISWGTEAVLSQTLAIARRLRLTAHQLRPLADVDYPEDLLGCRSFPGEFSQVLPTVRAGLLSIIIPTLNEERTMRQTLAPLAGLPEVEVIVADGGSVDATKDIAREMGVAIVPTRPGRGRQMNAGAALARGEVLLFLHADTVLPEGFQKLVWSVLASGAIAGAFPLGIDAQGLPLRIIEWGANLRSRFLQMPYGDQGLFLRAATFHRLEGYRHWPIMEDYDLCRRLRRQGSVRLTTAKVMTSGRRWSRLGAMRTTLVNLLCVFGFHLGVSTERLARWYGRKEFASDIRRERK